MKIYTKTGDQGKTRLVDGTCVEKFNSRVEAYGTVDELNSSLGLVRSSLSEPITPANLQILDTHLAQIQNELFILGSLLACEKTEALNRLASLEEKHILALENGIDQMSAELPPLKNFIIPAGHRVTCELHLARTICRRAERRCALICAEISVNTNSSSFGENHPLQKGLIYLNRLSDFLFTAARYSQKQWGHADVLWTSPK